MSPALVLWSRVAIVTAASFGLALWLEPPGPPRHVHAGAAVAIGGGVGLVLFVALARRRPTIPRAAGSFGALLANVGFFGLWATNEELVWRRVILGELLVVGALPAFAASTVGFALMHRARPGLHLLTGGAFGAVYLATGALAASVAAHWTYNVLVGALAERELRRAHAPP
jgi:membrane protease YdiL (CAAX protease family)